MKEYKSVDHTLSGRLGRLGGVQPIKLMILIATFSLTDLGNTYPILTPCLPVCNCVFEHWFSIVFKALMV